MELIAGGCPVRNTPCMSVSHHVGRPAGKKRLKHEFYIYAVSSYTFYSMRFFTYHIYIICSYIYNMFIYIYSIIIIVMIMITYIIILLYMTCSTLVDPIYHVFGGCFTTAAARQASPLIVFPPPKVD